MTSSHQNFILGFEKQSSRLGLTITKSLSVIGRMKSIQNYPNTYGSIWELKGKHLEYQISWSIAWKLSDYNPVVISCNLCLPDKLLLSNFSDKSRLIINKWLDLAPKCIQRINTCSRITLELSNYNYIM